MNANEIVRAIFRVAIKRKKKQMNAGRVFIADMKLKWASNLKINELIKDLMHSFDKCLRMRKNIKRFY